MTAATSAGIEAMRLKSGLLLFLPLCPSTNARMGVVRMGGACRQILTAAARDYIEIMSQELMVWRRINRIRPIQEFTYVDLWFILPRTNCDAHNYGKVLFDAMEQGGLVENDKFILPRYQGVGYGSDTCVAVKIPGETWEK